MEHAGGSPLGAPVFASWSTARPSALRINLLAERSLLPALKTSVESASRAFRIGCAARLQRRLDDRCALIMQRLSPGSKPGSRVSAPRMRRVEVAGVLELRALREVGDHEA